MSDFVLVTGADGFIGSHLVERLVRSGRPVRAMALYNACDSHGWLDDVAPDVAGQFEIFVGDVRDPGSVRAAVRDCRAVLNLAALIGIPYSYQAPNSYLETNVRGALNLLEAARENRIHVIQTSTSEVYGTAQRVPIDESHPLNAQSPYAATKIAADQLALSYHASYDLPVTVLRPFNTYGPRQSLRAVIPTIITQLAHGNAIVKMGAVHPTRDLNFVEDVARAFEAALDAPRAIGRVVNVGSGFEIAVGDLARIIGEEMGVKFEIVNEAVRIRPKASEVERLLADSALSRDLLGWEPGLGGIEGLRSGLRRTIDWFTRPENLNRYRAGQYTL